jgi:hypothetical protein
MSERHGWYFYTDSAHVLVEKQELVKKDMGVNEHLRDYIHVDIV